MTQSDSLNQVFRGPMPQNKSPDGKRQRRAERTRAKALSPVRILLNLMLVPFVTVAMTVSIFMRTSEFGETDALRHLIALGGCDAARKVQAAPAVLGQPGYHKRNDPDGDGVACDEGMNLASLAPVPVPPEGPVAPVIEQRIIGGAKFVKP